MIENERSRLFPKFWSRSFGKRINARYLGVNLGGVSPGSYSDTLFKVLLSLT